jgi:hypothetical protein
MHGRDIVYDIIYDILYDIIQFVCMMSFKVIDITDIMYDIIV